MLKLTSRQFLIMNAATFAFILLVFLTSQLSPTIFVIGALVMLVNAYLIMSHLLNSQPSSKPYHYSFLPPEGQRQEDKQWTEKQRKSFERVVRDASKKHAHEQTKKSMDDYLSWNKNYCKTAESIEDFRKNRGNYASKQSYYNDDLLVGDSSCNKKVRSFLTANRRTETDYNKRLVVEGVLKQWGKWEEPFKSAKLDERQINICWRMVNEHLSSSYLSEVDEIASNMKVVDSFLSRVFGKKISLGPQHPSGTISYSEMYDLVKIIQDKKIIPYKYRTQMPMPEILDELRHVLPKINALPQFWMAPNVIRLHLTVNQLKTTFPKLDIAFDGYDRLARNTSWNCQRFRLTQDELFYFGEYSQVKTGCEATVVLLFLLHNAEKQARSNVSIMRDLLLELGMRSY